MTHHARNLSELFRWQAQRLGERPGLRTKRHGMWVDVSWGEWQERVEAAALGLLGIGVQTGDRVAVVSENRLEWILADLAILSAGAITVPLHAPLGPAQIQQMLADSGAAAVIVSTAEQVEKVRTIAGELPDLRTMIVMDSSPLPRYSGGEGSGVRGLNPRGTEGSARDSVPPHPDPLPPEYRGEREQDPLSWQRLEQLGRSASAKLRRELSARQESLSPDHLAGLIYTSGTTGVSKGVMLTHGNFLSNAQAMNAALGPFAADAVFFNWLPLSHVYARTVDYYLAMVVGATLVLAESAETVVSDLLDSRPVHLSSVPRFYEKLLGSLGGLEPSARDERLRKIFGPRIGWLGCGGAALPPGVAQAYRGAGLEVVVGYGLTESSPVIATNRLGANKLGSVGQAIPGIDVAIAADGEILTRGPHVMKGYWNQPEVTAAVVRDGWLHTGDLGQIDEDGYLTITGRKKDLIVLSSGKNVAPTPIEGLLMSSPLIEQAVVFGEGRPFLAAVIVPRDDAVRREIERRKSSSPLPRYAGGEGPGVRGLNPRGTGSARDSAPPHPNPLPPEYRGEREPEVPDASEIAALLMEHVERILADAAPWEKVRKIVVAPRSFSVGREELTVSLKVRRTVIYEHYRSELESLY